LKLTTTLHPLMVPSLSTNLYPARGLKQYSRYY